MKDLEQQVSDFVASELSVRRERIHLSSMLSADLGVDGDDAVEFFQKYGVKFQVDLTVLNRDWDRHFRPEGVSGSPLAFLIVVGVAVVAGDLVHTLLLWIPLWAAMLSCLLLLLWGYASLWLRWFGDAPEEKLPISVQDLVDAAAAGQWRSTRSEHC